MRGGVSIFDKFSTDDVVFAFFPCVRFENQVMLMFRGQQFQIKNWPLKKKMEYDMKLLDEVNDMYKLVNQMFIVCINKSLRLIMENPYSEEHFLRRYWCFPAKLIDKDRRDNGDYFKKPTQYWFLNCDPKNNFLFEPIKYNHIEQKSAIENLNQSMYADKIGDVSIKTARSMIHPDYASRFIRQYILDESEI